ncbi:MAG: cell surface protein SprA [Bacteroidetes bacterium]|nr:cell surface protein SprA [Bacteroidota bacterium]
MHLNGCRHFALRQLVLYSVGALLVWILLAHAAAQGDHSRTQFNPIAPADTDSVTLYQVDSLRALLLRLGRDSVRKMVLNLQLDSLLLAHIDSLSPPPDTNERAKRYFSNFIRTGISANVFPSERRSLGPRMYNGWTHNIELDSTGTFYRITEQIADQDVRYPIQLTREQYQSEKLAQSLERNWHQILSRRRNLRDRQRRGLGLAISVPGGRQSGFSTIFGKNEVDLRVNGSADIRPAFIYEKTAQQEILRRGAQVTPEFGMDLRLGVTGTIGDKMKVNVDWDTNRDFDYQNQLELVYTGYEDEIIQSIEAGNVFLQTPSTLIRGGQSLFGIKSEFQLGNLKLSTVVSQQEGQSNSLSLDGGAETSTFSRRPTDYSQRKYYFLSYYFRNRWNEALSAPPNIILDGIFSHITDLEVWKLTPVAPEEQNVRQVIAVVDLGEPQDIVTRADDYLQQRHPNPNLDQYDDVELQNELRDGAAVPQDYLESAAMQQPLASVDYQVGQFKKLERGRDYDLDEVLGYITLRQTIQESEALAVSFRYLVGGTEVQVGDFSSQTGGGDNSQIGDRLVLKLLKPVNLQQPANLGEANQFNPSAWYLEMRNIYELNRGLLPTDFVLDISFEPPGRAATQTIQGVTGQNTLIQALGLDRLNEDGAPNPDNLFDFLPNYTIIPGDGLLIFPYLEPFGDRIEALIDASRLSDPEKAEARELYVFQDLYTEKRLNAVRNTAKNVYLIEGSHKGGIPSFYDLKAYSGLVEGSVRVTSGGNTLVEGSDYIVDYLGGTVTIVNDSYIIAGRDINIDYEANAFINLQQKTLLGARMEYLPSEEFSAGGTIMRLSQKSLTDKFRVGDEPISNTIWGIDSRLELEPQWLTRAIDWLPLIQTKEPSSIVMSGEFAQLRPSHVLTNAFKDQRRELRKDGRDFYPDETQGISYVDDFEGFENLISLMRQGAWLLSSAPTIGVSGEVTAPEKELTNDGRGVLGWYSLNPSSIEQIPGNRTPAVELITPQQVFPNRETLQSERFLTTFDLYFTPHGRGPYNYNRDLGRFLDTPREAWGGMIQRLTEGNTDFTSKNIEFVEFVMQPFPGSVETDPDAKLIIDIGRISEDVIPDNKLNTEDGLSLSDVGSVGALARLSTGQQNQKINPIGDNERITEDLGLDGLPSFPNNLFEQQGGAGTEQFVFREFLASLDQTVSASRPQVLAREVAKARLDPSGDDYHYFLDDGFYGNNQLFPGGASIQERFSRFFPGHELNTFDAHQKLGPGGNNTGNSRVPDSEDINLNSASDTENSYFQYEVPLNLGILDNLAQPQNTGDYIINEIESSGGGGTGWYLVRIPIRNFTRRVGSIQDFTLMESIRIWTTGHTSPITIRFATLELVGSQWRASEIVNTTDADGEMVPPENPITGARITIESVNNEENPNYEIPPGAVRNRIREPQSGTIRDAREQSMVIRAFQLRPNRHLGVFRTYTSPQNLLRYQNMRMFVHLNGEANNRPLEADDRGSVKLFVRIGANEDSDYYEYEQPLTPSPLNEIPGESSQRADYLWRTNQSISSESSDGQPMDLNSLNIRLSSLNQMKFLRDRYEDAMGTPFDPTEVFWSDIHGNFQSTIEEFAPPGTRIGVRGTPSLNRVTTIVIGVRNTSGDDVILDQVNLWVNELRMSGYDQEVGYAAFGTADMKLADLARLRVSMRTQSDGFGTLSSTLADRQQLNVFNWTVNSQLSLDKFIPERYGWAIPVSYEVKENTSIPRFDPNRGDIRVTSLQDAIAADSLLTAEEISIRQDQIREEAETYSGVSSYSIRVGKNGSRSSWLQKTIDGLDFSYSYSNNEGRTPTQMFRNSWRWTSSLSYRFQNRNPKVLRLFGWLDDVPVLNLLSGIGLNYLPNSFDYSLSGNRTFSASKQRPDPVRLRSSDLPEDVQFPIRQQHQFSHTRRFGLQYNPFTFLDLSVETNSGQSLNALGVDTLFSVILVDEEGAESRMDNTTLASLVEAGEIDESQIGVSAFEVTDLQHQTFGKVFRRALGGGVPGAIGIRPESYSSRFNATFRPRLQRYPFLSWLQIQDVGYSANFNWSNGSVGNNTGAQTSLNVSIRAGITLRPKDLFQKIPFYERLEEAERAAQSAAQVRRQQRQEERRVRREKRREELRQRREERRRQREAERAENEDEPSTEEEPDDDVIDELTIEDEPVLAPPSDESVVEVEDTTRRQGFRLPENLTPKALTRRLLLAITSVDDVAITYNGTRQNSANNVGRIGEDGDVQVNYTLYDAIFNDAGPSIRYRLGLDRTISPQKGRIISDRLQVSDALSDADRWTGRVSLNMSPQTRITLNWRHETTSRENLTYRILEDGLPGADTTQTADVSLSSWSFSASYEDLFRSQLNLFRSDCAEECTAEGLLPDTLFSTVLTNREIYDSFQSSYLFLGGGGGIPFPLPNWNVSYSGISNWPIIRSFFQSATLRHGYSSTFSADFRSNLRGGQLDNFSLGSGPVIAFEIPQEEVDAVRINERFQPLIAVDLTLHGNIQTSIAWNKTNAYSLSTTNNVVNENKSNEIAVTASWSKSGLRLPFLRRTLNNRINISMTFSRTSNDDRSYYIRRAIEAAALDPEFEESIALEEPYVDVLTSTSRIQFQPKIAYQFSNVVSADLFVRYEDFIGDSRRLPYTNINGGFNLRVNFSH